MQYHLSEIQSTAPQGHPGHTLAFEPIPVVTMPRVAETFTSVLNEMIYGTDVKPINLLHKENRNLTHRDLNTSIDEQDNGWSIHLVSYDTLKLKANPTSNVKLSNSSGYCGIFDESHWYKMNNSMAWQIAMNANIRFKPQVTATPGCHSLYDWCFQTMWLFSGAPEDPEDKTVLEYHGAEAL